MQVVSMLVITLGLAFSGVLGLALVTHATSRTRRRVIPTAHAPGSFGGQAGSGHRPVEVIVGHTRRGQ